MLGPISADPRPGAPDRGPDDLEDWFDRCSMTMTRKYPDLVSADRFTRGPALVVAPHPDDEVAACGGMLLHHVDAGNPVEVVFLTDGARGSWHSDTDPDYVAVREREARSVCTRSARTIW